MNKMLPAFLSCQSTRLSDAEKRLFAKYNPLGVCLFSKFCTNINNAEQVQELINDIKQAVERDNVLIAVDQEGGRVRRLIEPEFTPLASQKTITTTEQATAHAYLASHDLHKCGINVNFAPVLDTYSPVTSNVLSERCFEKNIAILGKAMIDEYIRCGICPCIKHLPGHGKAAVDPHLELPVITNNLIELEQDFYPFRQLNDAPMGMAAHIVLTAVDCDNAATVSPTVIGEIIRGKINFQGLLVSDAIMMGALKGSISEKARRTISAGCDVVCLGNAGYEANVELCESGIELSDSANERLNKIWKIIAYTEDFTQYEQIKNKYCTNLKNILSYNYDYDATEIMNKLRQS